MPELYAGQAFDDRQQLLSRFKTDYPQYQSWGEQTLYSTMVKNDPTLESRVKANNVPEFRTSTELLSAFREWNPQYKDLDDGTLGQTLVDQMPELSVFGIGKAKEKAAPKVEEPMSADDLYYQANPRWVGPAPKGDISRLAKAGVYQEILRRNEGGRAGFIESFGSNWESMIPFYGSVKGVVDVANVAMTARKLSNGDPVSDEELLDLNIYMADSDRGANATWLGKAGSIVAGSIGFAGEFVATAGIGAALAKLLGKAAVASGTKASMSFLRKMAVTKLGAGVYDDVGKAMGKKALNTYAKLIGKGSADDVAKFAASTGGKWLERGVGAAGKAAVGGGIGAAVAVGAQLASSSAATGEATTVRAAQQEIEARLLGKEYDKASAIAQSIMAEWIERGSEFMGKDLLSAGGALVRRVPGISSVADTLKAFRTGVAKALDEIPGMSPEATAFFVERAGKKSAIGLALAKYALRHGVDLKTGVNALAALGYDGIVEEMAEERAGGFLHGLFGTEGDEAGLRAAFNGMIPTTEEAKAELLAFTLPIAANVAAVQASRVATDVYGSIDALRKIVHGDQVKVYSPVVDRAGKPVMGPDGKPKLKHEGWATGVTRDAQLLDQTVPKVTELVDSWLRTKATSTGRRLLDFAITAATLPIHWDFTRLSEGSLRRALVDAGISDFLGAAESIYQSYLATGMTAEEARKATTSKEHMRTLMMRSIANVVETPDDAKIRSELDRMTQAGAFTFEEDRLVMTVDDYESMPEEKKRIVQGVQAYMAAKGVGMVLRTKGETFDFNALRLTSDTRQYELMHTMHGSPSATQAEKMAAAVEYFLISGTGRAIGAPWVSGHGAKTLETIQKQTKARYEALKELSGNGDSVTIGTMVEVNRSSSPGDKAAVSGKYVVTGLTDGGGVTLARAITRTEKGPDGKAVRVVGVSETDTDAHATVQDIKDGTNGYRRINQSHSVMLPVFEGTRDQLGKMFNLDGYAAAESLFRPVGKNKEGQSLYRLQYGAITMPVIDEKNGSVEWKVADSLTASPWHVIEDLFEVRARARHGEVHKDPKVLEFTETLVEMILKSVGVNQAEVAKTAHDAAMAQGATAAEATAAGKAAAAKEKDRILEREGLSELIDGLQRRPDELFFKVVGMVNAGYDFDNYGTIDPVIHSAQISFIASDPDIRKYIETEGREIVNPYLGVGWEVKYANLMKASETLKPVEVAGNRAAALEAHKESVAAGAARRAASKAATPAAGSRAKKQPVKRSQKPAPNAGQSPTDQATDALDELEKKVSSAEKVVAGDAWKQSKTLVGRVASVLIKVMEEYNALAASLPKDAGPMARANDLRDRLEKLDAEVKKAASTLGIGEATEPLKGRKQRTRPVAVPGDGVGGGVEKGPGKSGSASMESTTSQARAALSLVSQVHASDPDERWERFSGLWETYHSQRAGKDVKKLRETVDKIAEITAAENPLGYSEERWGRMVRRGLLSRAEADAEAVDEGKPEPESERSENEDRSEGAPDDQADGGDAVSAYNQSYREEQAWSDPWAKLFLYTFRSLMGSLRGVSPPQVAAVEAWQTYGEEMGFLASAKDWAEFQKTLDDDFDGVIAQAKSQGASYFALWSALAFAGTLSNARSMVRSIAKLMPVPMSLGKVMLKSDGSVADVSYTVASGGSLGLASRAMARTIAQKVVDPTSARELVALVEDFEGSARARLPAEYFPTGPQEAVTAPGEQGEEESEAQTIGDLGVSDDVRTELARSAARLLTAVTSPEFGGAVDETERALRELEAASGIARPVEENHTAWLGLLTEIENGTFSKAAMIDLLLLTEQIRALAENATGSPSDIATRAESVLRTTRSFSRTLRDRRENKRKIDAAWLDRFARKNIKASRRQKASSVLKYFLSAALPTTKPMSVVSPSKHKRFPAIQYDNPLRTALVKDGAEVHELYGITKHRRKPVEGDAERTVVVDVGESDPSDLSPEDLEELMRVAFAKFASGKAERALFFPYLGGKSKLMQVWMPVGLDALSAPAAAYRKAVVDQDESAKAAAFEDALAEMSRWTFDHWRTNESDAQLKYWMKRAEKLITDGKRLNGDYAEGLGKSTKVLVVTGKWFDGGMFVTSDENNAKLNASRGLPPNDTEYPLVKMGYMGPSTDGNSSGLMLKPMVVGYRAAWRPGSPHAQLQDAAAKLGCPLVTDLGAGKEIGSKADPIQVTIDGKPYDAWIVDTETERWAETTEVSKPISVSKVHAMLPGFSYDAVAGLDFEHPYLKHLLDYIQTTLEYAAARGVDVSTLLGEDDRDNFLRAVVEEDPEVLQLPVYRERNAQRIRSALSKIAKPVFDGAPLKVMLPGYDPDKGGWIGGGSGPAALRDQVVGADGTLIAPEWIIANIRGSKRNGGVRYGYTVDIRPDFTEQDLLQLVVRAVNAENPDDALAAREVLVKELKNIVGKNAPLDVYLDDLVSNGAWTFGAFEKGKTPRPEFGNSYLLGIWGPAERVPGGRDSMVKKGRLSEPWSYDEETGEPVDANIIVFHPESLRRGGADGDADSFTWYAFYTRYVRAKDGRGFWVREARKLPKNITEEMLKTSYESGNLYLVQSTDPSVTKYDWDMMTPDKRLERTRESQKILQDVEVRKRANELLQALLDLHRDKAADDLMLAVNKAQFDEIAEVNEAGKNPPIKTEEEFHRSGTRLMKAAASASQDIGRVAALYGAYVLTIRRLRLEKTGSDTNPYMPETLPFNRADGTPSEIVMDLSPDELGDVKHRLIWRTLGDWLDIVVDAVSEMRTPALRVYGDLWWTYFGALIGQKPQSDADVVAFQQSWIDAMKDPNSALFAYSHAKDRYGDRALSLPFQVPKGEVEKIKAAAVATLTKLVGDAKKAEALFKSMRPDSKGAAYKSRAVKGALDWAELQQLAAGEEAYVRFRQGRAFIEVAEQTARQVARAGRFLVSPFKPPENEAMVLEAERLYRADTGRVDVGGMVSTVKGRDPKAEASAFFHQSLLRFAYPDASSMAARMSVRYVVLLSRAVAEVREQDGKNERPHSFFLDAIERYAGDILSKTPFGARAAYAKVLLDNVKKARGNLGVAVLNFLEKTTDGKPTLAHVVTRGVHNKGTQNLVSRCEVYALLEALATKFQPRLLTALQAAAYAIGRHTPAVLRYAVGHVEGFLGSAKLPKQFPLERINAAKASLFRGEGSTGQTFTGILETAPAIARALADLDPTINQIFAFHMGKSGPARAMRDQVSPGFGGAVLTESETAQIAAAWRRVAQKTKAKDGSETPLAVPFDWLDKEGRVLHMELKMTLQEALDVLSYYSVSQYGVSSSSMFQMLPVSQQVRAKEAYLDWVQNRSSNEGVVRQWLWRLAYKTDARLEATEGDSGLPEYVPITLRGSAADAAAVYDVSSAPTHLPRLGLAAAWDSQSKPFEFERKLLRSVNGIRDPGFAGPRLVLVGGKTAVPNDVSRAYDALQKEFPGSEESDEITVVPEEEATPVTRRDSKRVLAAGKKVTLGQAEEGAGEEEAGEEGDIGLQMFVTRGRDGAPVIVAKDAKGQWSAVGDGKAVPLTREQALAYWKRSVAERKSPKAAPAGPEASASIETAPHRMIGIVSERGEIFFSKKYKRHDEAFGEEAGKTEKRFYVLGEPSSKEVAVQWWTLPPVDDRIAVQDALRKRYGLAANRTLSIIHPERRTFADWSASVESTLRDEAYRLHGIGPFSDRNAFMRRWQPHFNRWLQWFDDETMTGEIRSEMIRDDMEAQGVRRTRAARFIDKLFDMAEAAAEPTHEARRRAFARLAAIRLRAQEDAAAARRARPVVQAPQEAPLFAKPGPEDEQLMRDRYLKGQYDQGKEDLEKEGWSASISVDRVTIGKKKKYTAHGADGKPFEFTATPVHFDKIPGVDFYYQKVHNEYRIHEEQTGKRIPLQDGVDSGYLTPVIESARDVLEYAGVDRVKEVRDEDIASRNAKRVTPAAQPQTPAAQPQPPAAKPKVAKSNQVNPSPSHDLNTADRTKESVPEKARREALAASADWELDPATHKYTNKKTGAVAETSVTTLRGAHPAFSLAHIDEKILARAAARGTRAHELAEEMLKSGATATEDSAISQIREDMFGEKGGVLETELIVVTKDSKIAGSVDAVVFHDADSVTIVDWKSIQTDAEWESAEFSKIGRGSKAEGALIQMMAYAAIMGKHKARFLMGVLKLRGDSIETAEGGLLELEIDPVAVRRYREIYKGTSIEDFYGPSQTEQQLREAALNGKGLLKKREAALQWAKLYGAHVDGTQRATAEGISNEDLGRYRQQMNDIIHQSLPVTPIDNAKVRGELAKIEKMPDGFYKRRAAIAWLNRYKSKEKGGYSTREEYQKDHDRAVAIKGVIGLPNKLTDQEKSLTSVLAIANRTTADHASFVSAVWQRRMGPAGSNLYMGSTLGTRKLHGALQKNFSAGEAWMNDETYRINRLHKLFGLVGDRVYEVNGTKSVGELTREERDDIRQFLWIISSIYEHAVRNADGYNEPVIANILNGPGTLAAKRAAIEGLINNVSNDRNTTVRVGYGRAVKGHKSARPEAAKAALARWMASAGRRKLLSLGRTESTTDFSASLDWFALLYGHHLFYQRAPESIRRTVGYTPHVWGMGFQDIYYFDAQRDLEKQLHSMSKPSVADTFFKDRADWLDPDTQTQEASEEHIRYVAVNVLHHKQTEDIQALIDSKPTKLNMNRALLGAYTRRWIGAQVDAKQGIDPSKARQTRPTDLATIKYLEALQFKGGAREWTARSLAREWRGTVVQIIDANLDEIEEERDPYKRALMDRIMPDTLDTIELRARYLQGAVIAHRNQQLANEFIVTPNEDGLPEVIMVPKRGDPNDKDDKKGKNLLTPEALNEQIRLISRYLDVAVPHGMGAVEALEQLVKRLPANEYVPMKSPFESVETIWIRKGDSVAVMKHWLEQPFTVEVNGRDILNDLMGLTQWSKTMAVGYSVFFPLSVLESVAASPWTLRKFLTHPIRGGKELSGIFKGMVEVDPALMAELRLMTEEGLMLGQAYAMDEAIGAVDRIIKSWASRAGKAAGTKGSMVVERGARWVAGRPLSEKFFGAPGLHAGLFQAFKVYATRNIARQIAKERGAVWEELGDLGRRQIYHEIAPFVNDAQGGQFWQSYLWATPKVRQVLNLLMFAPNWTLSAFNVGGLGPLLGSITGSSASKMTQRLVVRNAAVMLPVLLFALPAALQYTAYLAAVAAGHASPDDEPWMWNNEGDRKFHIDITPINRAMPWYSGDPTGKRRIYMRFGKQAYEVYDGWLTEPYSQLMRKLSNPVKAALEQITGTSPGTDWTLEFKGKGLPGWFVTTNYQGESSIMKSRLGYLFQKIVPMTVLASIENSEAGLISLAAPISRGTSQYKSITKMTELLQEVADTKTWRDIRRKPSGVALLKQEGAAILEDAERNGYDVDLLVNTARGTVLGQLYKRFSAALEDGKEELMDDIASSILRVGGTMDGLTRSIKARRKMTGKEPTPEELAAMEAAMSTD